MSEHSVKFIYDRDYLRAELVCSAPEGAICRSVPICDCESYPEPEKDAQGWYHMGDNPDFDMEGPQDDTNLEEVEHRHVPGKGCHYQPWMEEILECGPDGKIEIAEIPVTMQWKDDYYTWAPEDDDKDTSR